MHRLMSMVAAAVCAVATGCGGSSDSAAPDVVISPRDLAQALADDTPGALAIYGGKVLELSGTIGEKVHPGGLNPTLGVAFASIDDRLAFDANLSFVSFDPEDRAARSDFDGLTVGDQVTLRCRLEIVSGSLFSVSDCQVVS